MTHQCVKTLASQPFSAAVIHSACNSEARWAASTSSGRVAGQRNLERLETLDVAAHRLSYSLLTDTPFRDCLTTADVRDLGPSQAELAWSATFQPDGIPASEAVEMLEGAFELNSRALQHFLAAGAP